jgi:hypothetical protein
MIQESQMDEVKDGFGGDAMVTTCSLEFDFLTQ